MKIHALVMGALGALGVVSCGDDDDTQGGGTSSSTSSTSGASSTGGSSGGSSSETDAGSSSSTSGTGGSTSTGEAESSSSGGGSSSGDSSSTGTLEALCDDGLVAPGEFCFETVSVPGVAAGDRGLEVLDLDGDGDLDIVTGTNVAWAEGEAYVLTSPLPGGPFIAAGQLDEDAPGEVAIPNGDRLDVHHVSESGVVGAVETYPFGGESAYAAKMRNFVGGPEPDVAVVGLDSSAIHLYENTPEGATPLTPLAPISFGASGARHVEVADLDDDGLADLIVAHDGAAVTIFRGTGGSFTAPTTTNTASLYTTITIGDVNDDGIPDIIGAAASGMFAEVLFGDGAGGVSSAQTVPLPVGPRAVGVGDFNSDGTADLVAVDYEDTTDLVIRFGEGEQTFSDPEVVAFPTWAHDLSVADVNDDGVDDVVVYGGEIAVLRSTP